MRQYHPQIVIRPKRGCSRKAGVFMYDPVEQRVLLVQSHGHFWGPPKGTVELLQNESAQECAVRELKEETGLDIKATEFLRSYCIKNRATYYYAEQKTGDVQVQGGAGNDANGITWIKIACLESCLNNGKMILNQHCRHLFKKFLGISLPRIHFTKVRSKRERREHNKRMVDHDNFYAIRQASRHHPHPHPRPFLYVPQQPQQPSACPSWKRTKL